MEWASGGFGKESMRIHSLVRNTAYPSLGRPGHLRDFTSPVITDIPLHCATKPVVAGFSPRALSSKRTLLSSRRTVVYLHPTNASRHQRKSLFSYPVRFGLSLAVDRRVRVHNEGR